jgi:hypothetical protein
MNNVGVSWEQIVALARSLEYRGGRSAPPEDPVLLARLVIEFHRGVVAQPLKRTQPVTMNQTLPKSGGDECATQSSRSDDPAQPRAEEAAA